MEINLSGSIMFAWSDRVINRDNAKWILYFLIFCIFVIVIFQNLNCLSDSKLPTASYNDKGSIRVLEENFSLLCWVAYAPTNFDPTQGICPTAESIKADFQVLREAGFNAIVTYGTDISVDIKTLPFVADSFGFQALILGIWDPTSEEEIAKVKLAGQHDLVLGFCVGNEGLFNRYNLESLRNAMEDIAKATQKPVTTTEILENYQNPEVLELGDWLFPNVHCYWHGITEPDLAADWTIGQYQNLKTKTNKPIKFKEVGLPTAGDTRISEQKQAEYFKLLKNTVVSFVYFEAFDQPWKIHSPVEPFWGLFRSDRSPKEAAIEICSKIP